MNKYILNSQVVKDILRQIVSAVQPDKIILFGSYAYGTPGRDSDIDLIVIKQGVKSKIEEYAKIRKSLKGIRFPFDIIVMMPEEYEYYSLNWKNSILAEVREKGVVIYGE